MNKKFVYGIVAGVAVSTVATFAETNDVAALRSELSDVNARLAKLEKSDASTKKSSKADDLLDKLGLKVYGKIHLSLDYLNDGENGSGHLSSNSSRLGFKGSSKINDDVNLFWQIENSVNFDKGNGDIAHRNTFVGFKTPCGQVKAGHFDTPYKALGGKGELFGDRAGDHRNILGGNSNEFDQRANNIITYTTPSLSGLNATLGYKLEDGTSSANMFTGDVMYKNGGLLAGVAYEQHGKTATSHSSDLGDNSEKGVRAVVSYKTGPIKAFVQGETIRDIYGSNDHLNGFGGGIAADVSEKVVVKGQIFATGGFSGTDKSGAVMYVGGVDYKLAPKTTLYLETALTANEANGTYGMSADGHGDDVGGVAGKDAYGVSFGLIHLFSL